MAIFRNFCCQYTDQIKNVEHLNFEQFSSNTDSKNNGK